jgi:uncharacterized protein
MLRAKSWSLCWYLLLSLLTAYVPHVYCQRLVRYISDQTNSLSGSDLAILERKLSDFDKATSTQVVVVIVPTIEAGSIEETSLRIAEENGIGRKHKNNGVLLFVAKGDRKIRIEVGYGLEGVLTDVISGQIIRREIAPQFRQGRFFEGINAGVDAIILATRSEYASDPADHSGKGMTLLPFVLICVLFILFSRIRRQRFVGGGVPPIFFFGGGLRRGSGGWGGGGGGFSGGGGSFGGGGSSGSW